MQYLRGNRLKPLSTVDGRTMREYTFIPLTYFMRHVRLGLIYRVKTTLKVLLALRVPEGELVYCGYDTLHEADGIFYLALCPLTMKNLRALLLEEGMSHLILHRHIFMFVSTDARSFLRLLCRLAPLRGIHIYLIQLNSSILNFF